MNKGQGFQLTPRLRRMAAAAVRWGSPPPESDRLANQTKAFFELYKDLPLRERQARSLAYALSREPVRVFPEECLQGIVNGRTPDPQWRHADWGEHSATQSASSRAATEVAGRREMIDQWPETPAMPGKDSFIINGEGIPGHVGWNYQWILKEGVHGVLERHRAALASASDPEAQAYYEGVLICWEAALDWNRQHVAELRRLRDASANRSEQRRLAESIALLERVPEHPARTFREAVQSFWFQWTVVMFEAPYGGNSPGRLDWFLWPYLQKELETGSLSYQEAGELVAELFIRIDQRVHPWDGHVNTIVIGGIGPNGEDGATPLSFLMLDVFEQLDLTHPAVYTRISSQNSEAYWDRCIEFLLHGGNRAQILADDTIIPAMMRDGRMPFEDAAMYMCGGCMELSPHGMNSDLLFSFIYNVPKTLELLVTGGECLTTGQKHRIAMAKGLADAGSFSTFYDAFVEEMARVLHTQFRCLDIYSEEMARHRPQFLLSSLVRDCLEKGRDQQDGGARYSDYGGTPLGLQNAADALFAIKTAVFEERFCSAAELVQALRADFVGHRVLHRRLLGIPKYGMGDAGADAMMSRVVTDVCTIFDSHRNRHGCRVKPIIFTFVWAPQMGKSLGASADGRKAGWPIAHGLTPQNSGMAQGITTAIQSCTSMPHAQVSGGASTMWDMDEGWIDHARLSAIVRTFIDTGGQIFQGNTTNVAELEEALENPDGHAHLIVRVGGYSARFTSLGRDVQLDIVKRLRHAG
ncbi:MAG: hypothetical protein KAI66_05890 [Lentisphaeria bacterium]|nr:hypothetical protein [Lentisphaeria bacterium]